MYILGNALALLLSSLKLIFREIPKTQVGSLAVQVQQVVLFKFHMHFNQRIAPVYILVITRF
jgi:hypothetical protein